MAEVSMMPGVNGYAPHQGYGSIEQQQGGTHTYSTTPASAQSIYNPPAAQDMASSTSSQSDIPKDEVGWYFVEQYYTTLSRSPEKLYLFYNKRSQFVSGQETDKVPVCVGQRAISDRIKELDFHDCKVRVTNVDSQASDANIVIQVVGEISNKGQPHKKFTQTFVLATQTNGYFVLNDIFRYLIEEEEEEQPEPEVVPQTEEEVQQVPAADSGYQEPPATAEVSAHETLTSSEDPAAVEEDAQEVDKELEEKVLKSEEPPAVTVNGDHEPEQAESNHVEEAPAAAAVEDSQPEQPTETELSRASTKEAEVQPEKPKDPSPLPVATPATQATPQPAAPPKPAAPKTWASLAASANRVATPATPQPPPQPRQATPAANSHAAPAPAPTPSAPTATPASAVPTAPVSQRDESAPPTSQDEWTAVSGHNRQQSRQIEQGQNRGYIKNVHEGIEFAELEAHLKQFGELTYFDIARQKVCAFVDFRAPEAYQAAVAANPHNVGNEKLYVEERRIRPGSTPYTPRGGPYGRGGGRGGVGQGPSRGDFGGGRVRGSFGAPRGARGGAPRGRGSPQAA